MEDEFIKFEEFDRDYTTVVFNWAGKRHEITMENNDLTNLMLVARTAVREWEKISV